MAALGSQSIASSYEQLLHVDADGGGNGTTLVSVKDGDNGTTFALQMATDKLRSTGDIRMASGKGIDFSDAGTAAEILDDYEEGTWSPVITDGTNNATMRSGFDKGSYTKIGNLVHIQGDIEISSLGSVSGDIEISGLPFAATSATARAGFSAGAFILNQGNITAGHSVVGQIVHGTSVIKLKVYDSTTGVSNMQGSEWSADGTASFAITYTAS